MTGPDQSYGAIPPPPPSFPPPGGPVGGPPGAPPHLPPPPPGGGGKGLWITLGVLGVIALVGVIVGLVLLLTHSDGDDDGRDSGNATTSTSAGESGADPRQVVQAVVDAAADDDCAAVEEHLTDHARDSDPCQSEEFELLASGDVEGSVGVAEVEGDRASVPVTFSSSEGGEEYVFTLEQSGDTWLVDSYGPGSDVRTDGPSASVPTDPSTGSSTPPGTSTADAIPNEPSAVVKGYLESSLSGDCATADDLVTAKYLREEGRCDPDEVPTELVDDLDYTVGKARVDAAGAAKVPVSITVAGQTQKVTITLVEEDGQWLIDSADEP